VARCIQAAQEQQDRIDRGMNYDSNGRFVPKSIPSNSYVLPGTR
jgi:predicted transcriptional regulator